MKTPRLNKKLTATTTLLAAGLLLTGTALAQQAPAAKPSTTKLSTAATTKAKAPTAKTASPLVLKTQREKASYALGSNIGANVKKSLQHDDLDIDSTLLLRGMKDALTGNKLLMTDEEAKDAFTAFQKEAHEKQDAKMKIIGEENKKQGEAFLAANKSKDGVVTLPSGLQYKVEKQGDGPKPLATDTVECNYRGTLIDGKEFDSSYKRGKPATFPVGGVIKGWTEVLQLMPVGSKYQVFIPSDLAYGPRAAGADIGPDATLIFEIELLSIKEKPAAATAAPAPPKPAEATKPAQPAK
jgi:FKBP-type peptidyl-prolyl cis-trans isomerase